MANNLAPTLTDSPASPDRDSCNVASHLPRMAALVPDKPAVIVNRSRDRAGRATYASLTFAELEALSNKIANGLSHAGIERGMRVLVMVKPGFDFIGLTFALFKMGVVPVMIDPGMGVRRLLDCVRGVDLHGFIGIPLAHVLRILHREPFRTVQHFVTVGRRWIWGGYSLSQLTRNADTEFEMVETRSDEDAAILFTSGSTGPAKGVVYEHGMFDAQVRMIQSHYGIEPGEVDLPAFPLFALFSTAMGMSCVIPDMNPSHPARVDPAKLVEAIRDHQVTSTFGSPAIWKRVASYCIKHKIELPSLRRVLIAGAPVPGPVIEGLHQALSPTADVHTPYGATESLPVASISGREVLSQTIDKTRHGGGTCVGKPLAGAMVRVIKITDAAIENWSDDLCVPHGEIGEICVQGAFVTKQYYGQDEATKLSKIADGSAIWHRIGDVGYQDEKGRLWFCGRKSHRVDMGSRMLFADQCEAVFNEHNRVSRTALVGVGHRGRQSPVLIVEFEAGRVPSGSDLQKIFGELKAIGRENELTREITVFLQHPSLPVDVRHNAKINREELTEWAKAKLRDRTRSSHEGAS